MTDPDPRKKLAYDESLRALQVQSSSLDALRSRTGILLAALSLTASFLGARALDIAGFSTWTWIAIGSFAASGLACLLVLFPWGAWHFVHDSKAILKEFVTGDKPASLDEMYVEIAETNQANWESNDTKLGRLFWVFRIGVLFLVLQVAFWLVSLGHPDAATEKTEKTTQISARIISEKERGGQVETGRLKGQWTTGHLTRGNP